MAIFSFSNLHVSVNGKEILKGLSLTIKSGEVHAIMGPNGSGKSTLAYALMGHPTLEVRSGKLEVGKKNILNLKANERAKMGLFLAFQNPLTVAGVPVASLLRTSIQSIRGSSFNLPKKLTTVMSNPAKPNGEREMSIMEFNRLLEDKAALLGLDKMLLRRGLNDGFSGGEKKKVEMLQALVLQPKFAIFDEVDTGLDVDALKTVAQGINQLVRQGTGVLIITHYQRILHHIKPDFVHIMIKGQLVKSGGYTLAEQIEKEGYGSLNPKS
ncbi:Fe-S cluster assembly ATPase SufC [Candidatus Woesebacteria bacterium]|nr:Fe-S cluster assembly ATPase SufC [Candidatus Woesebacteria bacterium]